MKVEILGSARDGEVWEVRDGTQYLTMYRAPNFVDIFECIERCEPAAVTVDTYNIRIQKRHNGTCFIDMRREV